MSLCYQCPRKCGVDRCNVNGFCGVGGELIRVGRASLHLWEEPCISGENGSGTIFFSGCNLGCVYCQNRDLSQKYGGIDITTQQLSDLMLRLQSNGAHNINLVTPSHYVSQIASALRMAMHKGLQIPVVYNTSGYDSVASLRSLNGLISVYLADFKYMNDEIGLRYSAVSDYSAVATAALEEMFSQVGTPCFDDNGMMTRGVIVRHLILPGELQNSKDVLNKVYTSFGDDIILSIMNQYTPVGNDLPDSLNRCVTESEYNEIVEYALSIGITRAFIQEEGTQQESFIPSFNGEGVLYDSDFNG
ncbi:MAG: 4Fe-4S cluster-binding domain-containing protein [Clostridia bacterium]|nr:4Fe-4S cluster-binding domain-containing protein [Clostridia bacterium]